MILDKPLSVGHFGEKGQRCIIYSVDVHPDGLRFATGGSDHRVKIWSMEHFRSPPKSAVRLAAETTTGAMPPLSPPPPAGKSTPTPTPKVVSPHVKGEEVKMLASLPRHTGSVLCVRWSHHGRYLASASDDTYVLIWELRPAGSSAGVGGGFGSAAPFGSSDAPNIENWSRVWVLRGHGMDVLDCAWSPDDSMLVSCSIDNTVIVWRMPSADGGQGQPPFSNNSAILNPFQTLRQHTSFVKGVAWDPIGRFIASIGEENRLLVWRVGGNWDVEATISEPFEGCEDTLVRRISWSPDGQFLVATNSKGGVFHTAVVFTRGQWDQTPTFLFGHSHSTLAASFSPMMYQKLEKKNAGTGSGSASSSSSGRLAGAGFNHVVAVAGRDNVITIWPAAADRPVVVLRDVFQQPPSDFSWSIDGFALVVSGHDGTVIVLRFSPEDLGHPVPEADRRAHLIKTYGKDAGGMALALDGAPSLVDNPRQLALEKSRREEQQKAAAVATAAAGGVSGVLGRPQEQGKLVPRPLQVESRSKDGRRRIQPMLLSNGNSGGGGGASSLTAPLVLTVPPHRGTGGGGAPRVGTTVSDGFGSEETPGAAAGCSSPRSGSKRPRIGGGSMGGSQIRQHVVGVRPRDGTVVRLRSGSASVPLVSPPEFMPRRGVSGSLVRQITSCGSKRRGRQDGGDAFRSPPRIREASLAVGLSKEGNAGRDGRGGAEGVAVMECSALDEEFRGLPARRYTVVTLTRGSREAWRDYVAGMATACCGNARVVAVGTEDGSVYVYDRNGVRSAPPLVISPPVAYLECSDPPSSPRPRQQQPPPLSAAAAAPAGGGPLGDYLMAISGDGDVFVWNLGTMTLAAKTSLAPLFRSVASTGTPIPPPRPSTAPGSSTSGSGAPVSSPGGGSSSVGGGSSSVGGDGTTAAATAVGGTGKLLSGVSVARAGVTAEGMPLVMLACSGAFGGALQAFALHRGLETWVRVADGRFALSDFYSSGPCTSPASRGGILSALQAGVRVGSSPTPAALLQASRAVGATWSPPGGMHGTGAPPAAVGGTVSATAGRESLQSAVTRGHLEDSLASAGLLGSGEEFVGVLKAYAGHLAKNAELGVDRIRALCDKLLLASDRFGSEARKNVAKKPPDITSAGSSGRVTAAGGKGELLGLRLGDGPSVLGLNKLNLLREVVLPALSGNRSLQRLVSEYYDALDFLPDRDGAAGSSSLPVADRHNTNSQAPAPAPPTRRPSAVLTTSPPGPASGHNSNVAACNGGTSAAMARSGGGADDSQTASGSSVEGASGTAAGKGENVAEGRSGDNPAEGGSAGSGLLDRRPALIITTSNGAGVGGNGAAVALRTAGGSAINGGVVAVQNGDSVIAGSNSSGSVQPVPSSLPPPLQQKAAMAHAPPPPHSVTASGQTTPIATAANNAPAAPPREDGNNNATSVLTKERKSNGTGKGKGKALLHLGNTASGTPSVDGQNRPAEGTHTPSTSTCTSAAGVQQAGSLNEEEGSAAVGDVTAMDVDVTVKEKGCSTLATLVGRSGGRASSLAATVVEREEGNVTSGAAQSPNGK